jgi:predicted dienelactone hydrolase
MTGRLLEVVSSKADIEAAEMKKVWAVLGVVILLSAGFLFWMAKMPERAQPTGALSQQRYEPGPYQVVKEDFHAVDQSRPTSANREYAGSHVRTFKGSIWRATKVEKPMPLLVYSHGFMSFHDEGAYIASLLASNGYTVVSVNYPLTHFLAPGKPRLEDVVNQPADVTFLISTMLARATDSGDVLYKAIDPERIAVAGLSLGGLTSELVAFHSRVYDPRIKASVSIAGPAAMLTSSFFQTHPVPFMMLAGDIDAMVPYESNAASIPQRYPGSVLVTLKGGSHAGFSGMAATFLRFYSNPDSIGCDKLKEGLQDVKDNFLDSLSGEEYGVVVTDRRMPCEHGAPKHAMKAPRQHMFTALAISAFLESVFAETPDTRARADQYLKKELVQENGSEISVVY